MSTHNASARNRFFVRKGWRRNLAFALLVLAIAVGAAYATRCTLLLNVARIYLSRDADLKAQEHRDGVSIDFPRPPSAWVRPMKNLMNPIWGPIQADGVNYFTFAAPQNPFRTFSERSNPNSPYYQAWVGAYVTKRKDGTLPADTPMWASEVTALDQRSWLSAMGDPSPLADFGIATPAGTIEVDGHSLQLWHGTMHSHSDLSAHPEGPLATLLGMPPKSLWPPGTHEFHELILDGYFVCWSDLERHVSIVVYAVAAVFADQSGATLDRHRVIKDELLDLMKSAKVEAVH